MSLNARAIAVQGIGFGASATAAQGFLYTPPLTQYEVNQGGGAGRHHWIDKTSRYSDDQAYTNDRVAERLEAVVINGKSYDPFTPNLIEILEAAAKTPEPEHLPEIERQERKLARTFKVMTENRVIDVPMYRPMLRELPKFAGAWGFEFEQYAERAREEANEERKRILMLLTAADWP